MTKTSCELCNSQNIFRNKILDCNICGYCLFSFQNNIAHTPAQDIKISDLFIKFLPNIEKYKNSILISSNDSIRKYYNTTSFDEGASGQLDKKQLSKLLHHGKIDCVLIPDSSFVSLKSIMDAKDFFLDNIEIYFGISTPKFVLKNKQAYLEAKYVYSLFSVSKFISINNLDIHDFDEDTDYILLKIKLGECKEAKVLDQLQKLWDDQETSPLFNLDEQL